MSKKDARRRVPGGTRPPIEPGDAMVADEGRGRLPPKFIVTSLAATLNLTAAMLGLGFPQEFPALAARPVMLTLFAVGIGLEVWAVRQLLAARRAERGRAR
ncbi:MAG: hypothetical protein KDG52_11505 [Rhodocyclaceae bacterium]|nr:hypothetical protein [Rhodocyclaceae bacterium]